MLTSIAWAQSWMTGRAGFFITRGLIGALEGGFVPGIVLFFTFFYTSKQLGLRFAIISSTSDVGRSIAWSMDESLTDGPQISHALAALVAAGVLKMRGVLDKPGWFWLFIIEGILTTLIGLLVMATHLYLPAEDTLR